MNLLTIPEAAAQLRMSQSWLRHEVAARSVPHRRIGRRVFFTDADLAAIIRAGEVEPLRPTRRRLRSAS